MVPINISEQESDHLARTFKYAKGRLPFTYLELPLSLTKPRVVDFRPLVTKCERRLATASTFLSQAGRLEPANSVIIALPTFAMSIFSLHSSVFEQIDK
jgi:hypothetical protein